MNKRMGLFILASVAIHAAVLVTIRFEQPEPISLGSPFRISIEASRGNLSSKDHRPATPSQNKPRNRPDDTTGISPVTIAKQPGSEQTGQPVAITHNKTFEPVEPVQATTRTTVDTPENHASMAQRTASLLRDELRQAFSLHFYYPRLAVRKGWQGQVNIGLHVNADGQLSNIRVVDSSGYGILDRAAVSSLGKVEILSTAIALLDGHSLDLVLPVEYHLL